MYLTRLTCLIAVISLSGCNPLIGASSFLHSVVTGNTVGIVTGGAGVAVEQTTGKTVGEHVLDTITTERTRTWIALKEVDILYKSVILVE